MSYAPLGPRIRRRQKLFPVKVPLKLGYFQSAQVNGLGQIVGMQTPETTYNALFDCGYRDAQMVLDEVHPGPPYQTGGPFKSLRLTNAYELQAVGKGEYWNRNSNPSVNGGAPYPNRRYVGGFQPPQNEAFGFLDTEMDLRNLLSLGSARFPSMDGMVNKAWSRTKPRIEQAAGYIFVRESGDIGTMFKTSLQGLRDLRSSAQSFSYIWKTMGGKLNTPYMTPKKAADQFLTEQFGWAPFLNDLLSFNRLKARYQDLVYKITRENGKEVHRRVNLVDDEVTTVLDKGTYAWTSNVGSQNPVAMPLFPNSWTSDFFSSAPSYQLVETKTTRSVGVGRFKYYRPEFDWTLVEYDSTWNEIMRFITLAGLRPTPSNIYKAIPWTWALDWVSNMGDLISYYSDILLDSMPAKYLYVMTEQVTTRTFTNVLPFWGGPKTLSFSRVLSTKQRVAADSPYEFSLSWGDLSARQLAIAGALGLSRV